MSCSRFASCGGERRRYLLRALSAFLFVLALNANFAHAAAAVGVWTNVTPAGLDPTIDDGTTSVQVDPRRASNLYAQFGSQGVFKSADYGVTWTKVSTGKNGSAMNSAGGIAIADGGAGNPPILYAGNFRNSMGFWRSLDGGVSWTNYNVGPLAADRQDLYPPVVDPYDPQHLIMCGHEQDALVQSTDGGQTWTKIPMASGMNSGGGTSFLFFINTGSATTTRNTWLFISQQNTGTWRTTDGGRSWTQVDLNTHPHGASQIYQQSPGGPVYMAGVYSSLGWGVLRSADLGQTWTHVGNKSGETIVFGTPNNVYSAWGWAIGNGAGNIDPALEVAPQPGVTGWVSQQTPAGMHNGGPAQAAVTFDGSNYIIVVSNWNGGLWRYIEPTGATSLTPAVSLSASATNITLGSNSMLTWSSSNATSCTASGGWTGTEPTSGTQAVTPTSTTTYTLTCSGAKGTSSPASAMVTVAAASAVPTVSLSASATSITSGGNSTLTWASTNATSCTASGGWTGTKVTSGTLAVSPTKTTTYTLTCTGAKGTSSPASATVTVAASTPPTVSLSASATSITSGGNSTLAWSSTNATSCTASGGWTGTKAASGTLAVSPASTTTYTLTCTGAGGTSSPASATVTVAATSSPTQGSSGSGSNAGVWSNVTPSHIDLVNNLSCGNYGTESVQADPSHPTDAYTLFFCQGIHKSSDYGRTWTGPINTGRNAARLTDCAGTITVVPTSPTTAPTLYAACIRGTGTGLWKSVNGGVDWTQQVVAQAPSGTGQQFNAPVADPYDSQHLLMAGHATNLLLESTNGGSTWSRVNTNPGMAMKGGTGGIQFINTAKATTTRTSWLWLAAQAGGTIGTWRTTNAGANWTKVDKNEHINGETQIYQPDTSGVMFMAGVYSGLGSGVLKSTNFGQTWTHAGLLQTEGIVFGTSNAVYAMYGWAAGSGQVVGPRLQTAAPSGTGTWISPATPAQMSQGPAQAAVLNDGTSNVILTAHYNAGLWRYVESTGATSPTNPTTTVSLSASATSITPGGNSTLTWSSTNVTSCTASGGWTGTKAANGTLAVTPASTTTYTLTCTGAGGTSSSSATVTVAAVTTLPTVSLSASPTNVPSGNSSTLTWSSTNATSCTASGGWAGTRATSGTLGILLTKTTTYTLTCTGAKGTSSPASATVTVSPLTPLPTVSLSAAATNITAGGNTTVTWSSTNATSCTASGGWTGTKATSGTLAVSPTSTATYTLTCTGAGGTSSPASATVTVTASAPPTGGLPSGPNFKFTSAPTLSGIGVIPNRHSVIVKVPAVANARDFRVLVQPTGVKANTNSTETVTGGTQFCAGLPQHQARTRFVADNVTQFPYYFYVNSGHDSPTNEVPQFFGPPPGAWSFHDLDTPPNLQIEVTGVTGPVTVTVEAIDRLCPFPGTIGRTHADILLSHTVGDNNNPGNPWIDASALTTFPIVTEAEVIAKYGSLIINGQGWAGGPNVQANPPLNPPFAQPAPVNPPVVLARGVVTIAPLANPPAPPATFFDDFSNANDAFQALPVPKWTYPRDNSGQKILQNSKWTVYANGYTCCGPNAPDGNYGYADAYVKDGVMNTILSDWSQGVFSEVSMFPRKPAHLNSSTYLHVTYEVPSFATARRYWVVSLCGSSTAGQTLDSTGALKEQVVHTTFFYNPTGANPSTAGWNCLQVFNREGNSYAFGNWESMYNIHGGRPPVPPNKGLYDLADYIYNTIPSIADPSKIAAYTVHPESDVMVMINKPIPAAGLPEKLGTNEQVAQGTYTSPVNVSPLQLDNPADEVAWFYKVDSNGNPVAPILDDQQLVSPRTKYDLYIRNNRLIMYVNGQARLCNDFTTPTTTLHVADAAVGFHQVLYHSSAEFVERFVDPDRGAAYHYRYNSPWVDRRTWANMGFEENVAAPSDFNPATCYAHTSLGAENNEP